jgi:predicted ribosome quality control (RQC) complex YloA/Tae2 family protein
MHFDALTLACVAHELQETIAGGRVQQVLLPDAHSVGMELYAHGQRSYLLISAQAGAGRIHLAQTKLRRGVEQETPLLLLLRKYVREGTLTAVNQADPTERLLFLEFDHRQHGQTRLVVEPMGRLSNALLLDAKGMILECVHRVRPGDRAQRVLLPRRPYAPPPRQDKIAPWDDGSPGYYERLASLLQRSGPLWKAIAEEIAGASPTLGREVAWRAAGSADAPAHAATVLALAQTLQELWAPAHDSIPGAAWQPGVVEEGGAVVAFSAYPLHFRDTFVACPSISLAVERFYAAKTAQASTTAVSADSELDGYRSQRAQAGQRLERTRRRIERQLQALAADEPAPGAAQLTRTQAEWLLALHTQIKPGQQVLEVEWEQAEEPLRIALDPAQSPIEQAQQMFKRAAKMERAAKAIPIRRAQLQQDLAFVEQLEMDLAAAQNQPEIAAVVEELRRAGLLVETKQRSTPLRAPRPGDTILRYTSPDGFEILVGRNAQQNELVTFQLAQPEDAWLHARGAAGSHVVIRVGGRRPPTATLHMAAQLAAYYSKLRGERAATVILTQRRHVTRAPGGHTGQVLVRQEETMIVPADLPKTAKS